MEIRRRDLDAHANSIAQVLCSVCGIGSGIRVIPQEEGRNIVLRISRPHGSVGKNVTTDMGHRENVVGLPAAGGGEPKYWIGMHEQWTWARRDRLSFVDCGLRVYSGTHQEDGLQFLRLEWVAPMEGNEGEIIYDGEHAGHPHWHIDRSALIGPQDYWNALEALTAPEEKEVPIETFGDQTLVNPSVQPRYIQDFSWLTRVHLPAQAGWMHSAWNGMILPGPHQSEPESIDMLSRWLEGALRYVAAEITRHGT